MAANSELSATRKASVVVVEDKFLVAEDIANSLRRLGYEVPAVFHNASEAISFIAQQQPDLVLMDIGLPGSLDGIQAAEHLRKRFALPVVYLTAYSDQTTLERAAATAPLGYLLKPFEERQLLTTLELALNQLRIQKRNQINSHNLAHVDRSASHLPPTIIATHPSMMAMLERVNLVARTDVTAHIYGESGTGKELVADAIHSLSPRCTKPFVKLNCSAIPATLLESALFGHSKGAFTGATKEQLGFVEHADGGTLFLDEVGDVAHEVQVKLLRLLQSREYARVGESKFRTVDIRIITATNRNLKELLKEGKIREDFFYRIHVFPIVVPPLRERACDILPLAHHFAKFLAAQLGKPALGFTSAAEQALRQHHWPGNVRELENAIRHAYVIAPSSVIDVQHLPTDLTRFNGAPLVSSLEINALAGEAVANHIDHNQERAVIVEALRRTAGNRTHAAKLLGYSRVTLWKKMNQLGLELPAFPGSTDIQ